jgi:rSAM/selenodomain-associated transferase 2
LNDRPELVPRVAAGRPQPSSFPTISVVIPTLDEQARIEGCLRHLLEVPGLTEVVVVDGGSSDRTVELAATFDGVRVLRGPRGRGSQMNAGAAAATGDVLLFLHADVTLPRDAAAQVASLLVDPGTVAGAFRTWTVDDRGGSRRPAPWLHLADLRSRYSRLPYGDQALFVRAAVFRELGGYAPIPLMEDLDLSRRLRVIGRIRVAPVSVIVSGRRFLERPLYYFLVMNGLPLLYRLGVPPRILVKLYANVR